MELGEPRAVKRVAKPDPDFLREAELMKRLRAPGIPILYDFDTTSDNQYYYLIEEYLGGESLKSLVMREGRLKAAEITRHGLRLCRILMYLHSCTPEPVFYTDLQPANLMLSRGELVLIDFDRAVVGMGHRSGYGTPGFAAPEQFRHGEIDARTDIYGLGAVLFYMMTGHPPEPDELLLFEHEADSRALRRIILRCLAEKPEERFQTAAEVYGAMSEIGRNPSQRITNPFRIAVCGSARGVGTTSCAMRFARFLGGKGFRCLVSEQNQTKAMRKLADYLGRTPDEHGVIAVGTCAVRPFYGSCVRLEDPDADAVISDCGTELQSALRTETDLLILLCGAEDWQMQDSIRAIRALAGAANLRIVFRGGGCHPVLPEELTRLAYFRMPEGGGETEDARFFSEVLQGSEAVERYRAPDPAASRQKRKSLADTVKEKFRGILR